MAPLEARMSRLAGRGLTPDQILGLERRMVPLEDRMRGLAGRGLTDQQITGLEGRIDPLERRMSGLAGFGLTDDQILGLESQMVPLENRMAGLAGLGLTESQIAGLEQQMVPLENRMAGLAGRGLTESQIAGLESRIDPLATRMSGLADLALTEDQIAGLESQIDPLATRMSELAGLANFAAPEAAIAGLAEDMASLGSEVDFSDVEQQIKGLEDRVGGIGETGETTFAGKATAGGSGGDTEFADIDDLWRHFFEWADNYEQTEPSSQAAPSATGAAGYMDEIQEILTALAGADPMTVGEYDPVTGLAPAGTLRGDPITAALLSDLRDETEEAEKERIRQLQRMGVLKSGVNIDTGVDLDEARLRAEYDILGQAAERARADRELGLTRGIDLAGMEADLELATGEMLGRLGSEKTLGGREADLGVIASMLAALDPQIAMSKGVNVGDLARAILSTSGFSEEDRELFSNALGIGSETDLGRILTGEEETEEVYQNPDGTRAGSTGNASMDEKLDDFFREYPSLGKVGADNAVGIIGTKLWKGSQVIAIWDTAQEKWIRR